jgi:hypothetical protein
MAKRYIRLNFQNSPSTATPLNSTNLNKMDKGIDDIDTALENHLNNIVQTDAINDTTKYPSTAVTYAHGQAIATLNNNLAYQIIKYSDWLINVHASVAVSGPYSFVTYNGVMGFINIQFQVNAQINAWATLFKCPFPTALKQAMSQQLGGVTLNIGTDGTVSARTTLPAGLYVFCVAVPL